MELKKVRSHIENTLYFLKIQNSIILRYFRFESGMDQRRV
ncbi:hypothetical protein LEP1GSC120_3501 [Leptospira santarosai str. 200702252]|nr:hypothetical protein LEP1GSC130_2730 [Leptospira santarosai str. 200403458]EMO96914.1 hypothetical protein LEP1GSC120_3501 [Leptospira santarosai str. 200702252]